LLPGPGRTILIAVIVIVAAILLLKVS
jgi:hypothetical protein